MADPICDMSDLPKSQCGLPCCKPPPPRAETVTQTGFRRGGRVVIEASTWSTCDECGEKIRPGDKITPNDSDDWIHEECA